MAHAHAGRGDIQVLTAVGQPENPAIGINGSDGHHRRVGCGIHGLGHRPAVAGGGQDHHIALGRALQGGFQQPVGRAGQADINHIHPRRNQPVQGPHQADRTGYLATLGILFEYRGGEDLGVGGYAHEVGTVSGDNRCDCRAVITGQGGAC